MPGELSPRHMAALITKWGEDPNMTREKLVIKAAALVEMYGRTLLQDSDRLEDAEVVIYKALRSLYDSELTDAEKISGAADALSEYVSK